MCGHWKCQQCAAIMVRVASWAVVAFSVESHRAEHLESLEASETVVSEIVQEGHCNVCDHLPQALRDGGRGGREGGSSGRDGGGWWSGERKRRLRPAQLARRIGGAGLEAQFGHRLHLQIGCNPNRHSGH